MPLLPKRFTSDSPIRAANQIQVAVQLYAVANPATVVAHFFDRQLLDKLLGQHACVGIRVYFGLDEQNRTQLVAVGTDALLNDMLRGHVLASSQPSAASLGGRLINKRRAAQWTANHRRNVAGHDAFFGFLFEEHALAILLDNECQGIRFHYALDRQDRVIIVPSRIEKDDTAKIEYLAPDHIPCPPCCAWEDWWSLLGFSLNQDGPRSQQLRVSTATAQSKQPV